MAVLLTVSKKKSDKEIQCLSCPDAIGRAIEKYMKNMDNHKRIAAIMEEPEPTTYVDQNVMAHNGCPDCGASIEREGGCIVCRMCGYSKCN